MSSYTDHYSAEKLQKIMDRWDAVRERLIEIFPYGKQEDRPDIFRGLIHDGNRAANMTKISLGDDQEHSLRARWSDELSWFVRIAEYVVEKESDVG